MTETMTTFFAMLGLACWAGVIVVGVAVLLGRAAPAVGVASFVDGVRGVALWLAWLVSIVTTLGSLYYSEVAHYVPCELCWYQRICIYPFSVVLLIAAIRRDVSVWRYVLPVSVIGMGIAAYHTQLQAFPEQRSFCSVLNPCTIRYVWEFGFVSLPFMALAALTFVALMMLLVRPRTVPSADATSTPTLPEGNS
jgi:disulfide bond formation protein DsbB